MSDQNSSKVQVYVENVAVSASRKEYKCLLEIVKGNDDGSYLDKGQLSDRINHSATLDALVFTLRHMIKKGFIQKEPEMILRNGRYKTVFSPTSVGRAIVKQYSGNYLQTS